MKIAVSTPFRFRAQPDAEERARLTDRLSLPLAAVPLAERELIVDRLVQLDERYGEPQFRPLAVEFE
jgi:hypothetical protein